MDIWIPVIGMITSSVMVVLIVYFIARSRQRRVELQTEVQSRLIDRFGSAPELVQFLQSPAGRQFVTGVQSAPVALTREHIMSGFTRGIVLSMLGIAFIGLTIFYEKDFAVPAAILSSLGIGYLIATLVSYRLASRMVGGSSDSSIS